MSSLTPSQSTKTSVKTASKSAIVSAGDRDAKMPSKSLGLAPVKTSGNASPASIVAAKTAKATSEKASPAAVVKTSSKEDAGVGPVKTSSLEDPGPAPTGPNVAGGPPLVTPPKTPSPVLRTSSEKSKAVKQPYQKVKPQKKKRRAWWSSKKRSERQRFIVQVIVFSSVVLLVAAALIALGIYFMWQERKDQPTGPDPALLTTKSEMCWRAYGNTVDKNCLFEPEDIFGKCDTGEFYCDQLRWEFEYGWGFIHNVTYLHLENTEYAECGYLQWCRRGKCVHSGIEPTRWRWPTTTYGKDGKPFKKPSSDRREKGLKQLPCMTLPTNTDGKDEYENLIRAFGHGCNHSVCSQPHIEFGIRIEFNPCEKGFDRYTGVRTKMCEHDHQPMRVIRCRRCPNYSKKADSDYRANQQCKKLNPDWQVQASASSCSLACRNSTGHAFHIELVSGLKCKEGFDGTCVNGICYRAISEMESAS